MNYNQEVKILQQQVPVSMAQALKLLKNANGIVPLAVEQFHQENINHICEETECNLVLAREFYEKYNYNAEKAIAEILKKPVVFASSVGQDNSKIGYVIYGLDENFNSFSGKRGVSAFISEADFEYIKSEFQAFYPRINPLFDEMEEEFNATSDNVFDRQICLEIIERLQQKVFDSENVTKFVNDLLWWLRKQLEYAHYINFYGNL
ncbi:hypothetical protein [Capnocytophaga stomatis]|uniref:SMI1/KNR4 family protein n=1 Tax=Capnocytophaga stomatis TaxID=1848904 RepID=A0ABW8QB55_9FLAO|nr:hypothetical protein [Capnocytophaga stomatis]GIJ93720.1 hypothetical protein CAPN002_09380 [Capnocytophaga stomatis]GIJ96816.1 hypothetical protein CAPN001_13850 [Capnocytophaga stomatis]GIM48556.1 hypothetical protein CAPN003_00080 [Capnocytophaga stomatis]